MEGDSYVAILKAIADIGLCTFIAIYFVFRVDSRLADIERLVWSTRRRDGPSDGGVDRGS